MRPHELAAPASPSTPRRKTRPAGSSKAAADRPSSSSSARSFSGYSNLAQASLSTPELHLSSDPLIDAEDAQHRFLVFPQKDKVQSTSKSAPKRTPKGSPKKAYPLALANGGPDRTHSTEVLPLSGEAPYSSLGAVLGAVVDSQTDLIGSHSHLPDTLEEQYQPADQEMQNRTGTVIMRDYSVPATSKGPGTAAISSAGSTTASHAPDSLTSRNHGSASSNWFKRARKWSAASRAKDSRPPERRQDSSASTNIAPSSSSNSSQIPPRPSISSSIYSSGSDPSTMEDGSVFFSDSVFNSSITQISEPNEASVVMLDADTASLDRLRSARTYMVEELSKLSQQEMGQDSDRVSSLAWFSREKEAESRGLQLDSSREMLEFWSSISSGVLLCLLANRLKPGAVGRIDRRDIEWVKADNLSRFLRAARDFFGVRSKDLFHPLDLADATVEGLDRAVCTILAMQRTAKSQGMSVRSPSSPVTAEVLGRVHSKRRSLIASPPQTPESRHIELASDGGYGTPDSPYGSPSRKDSFGSKRDRAMTIQQHRQAAEDKLMRAVSPPPLVSEAQIRARRRRSSDTPGILLPGARTKTPSITFAESSFNTRPYSEDASRLQDRDRKMSESAISLTEVAEEDVEELAAAHVNLAAPSEPYSEVFETSPSMPSSPTFTGLNRPRPAASPLVRTSSQRRISQEIGLGQSPRGLRGSLDGGDEFRIPGLSSGSPARHSPARRHSARAGYGVSALNPSRDFSPNLSASEAPSTAAAQVPFPRSTSSGDSAHVKRKAPVQMTLESDSGSASSSSPFLGYSLANGPSSGGATGNASSAIPARPTFRHMRYTSELQLPSSQKAQLTMEDAKSPLSSDFAPARPIPIRPRNRVESDVGSLYSHSANAVQSSEDLGNVPRPIREKAAQMASSSRHKLVLTEGGKNVTYQMGNCIGRGQFGSVYRALNLNSGQMVAVKRIKLEGRSEDEVTQLMQEVDLLKSLTHPSVVKYEGLVRGKEVVSIILEYVENGSLLHTLKAFGEFPEKLVASYVVKILEGLNYLHEMKVVHCDLKAANILTTKNGNVKLSDFGVSLNLQAMERVQKNDAVGTPNWMAPEVIELKGASTAADIWSLGCTIIELLTGKPPYGDMLAMSAMFRIVEDDRPPIPEKCSDSLRDFLIQCFDKDPTKRPTAEALFEHEWLRKTWTGHKELRPQDSVPFLKRISLDSRRLDVRALHAAVNEVAEPTEVRTGNRPTYADMRSFSDPSGEAWNVSSDVADAENINLGRLCSSPLEATSSLTPPVSAVRSPASASAVSVQWPAAGSKSNASLNQCERGGMGPISADPSMLDLNNTALDDTSAAADNGAPAEEESDKPHSFVKSTFSKAVRCRICGDNVRKHAVLCEDCGLICHASCARDVGAPCNLRAQMLMFTQKGSQASPRDEIPSTSANGSLESPSGGGLASPGLLPMSFRFPFAKARRHSRTSLERVSTLELQHADELQGEMASREPSEDLEMTYKGAAVGDGAAATSKDASAERHKGGGGGGRYRRISLMAVNRLRALSPGSGGLSSPGGEPVSGVAEHRRASSISYGSMSGSSTVSSNASNLAAAMEPTGSTGSAAARHRAVQARRGGRDNRDGVGHRVTQSTSLAAAVSTPHLVKARASSVERRHSTTQTQSGGRTEQAVTGPAANSLDGQSRWTRKSFSHEAQPGEEGKKLRTRKTSFVPKKTKEECVVM